MDSRRFRLSKLLLCAALFAFPLQAARVPGLYAAFKTTKGEIICRLFTEQTPGAVRNFGQLAQGVTSWTNPKTGKKMLQKEFYDGLPFYKVVAGALIYGGDPVGDGAGGPGFTFEDEIRPELTFNQPGRLAFDNSGPNTNGSRFFITAKAMPELNGQYTIFGEVVAGLATVASISKIETDKKGRPKKSALLEKIEIFRVEEPKSKKKQ